MALGVRGMRHTAGGGLERYPTLSTLPSLLSISMLHSHRRKGHWQPHWQHKYQIWVRVWVCTSSSPCATRLSVHDYCYLELLCEAYLRYLTYLLLPCQTRFSTPVLAGLQGRSIVGRVLTPLAALTHLLHPTVGRRGGIVRSRHGKGWVCFFTRSYSGQG